MAAGGGGGAGGWFSRAGPDQTPSWATTDLIMLTANILTGDLLPLLPPLLAPVVAGVGQPDGGEPRGGGDRGSLAGRACTGTGTR